MNPRTICSTRNSMISNGTCRGTGCCQSEIPQAFVGSVSVSASVYNHTYVSEFNPRGYSFLAQEGAYTFSTSDLVDFRNTTFPAVVEWAVQNRSCQQARNNNTSYACHCWSGVSLQVLLRFSG